MPNSNSYKNLEQRVQERSTAAQQARLLFDLNADGMMILDRDGRIITANPAAVHIFGRMLDALAGQDFGMPLVSQNIEEIDIPFGGGGRRAIEMIRADITWDGQEAYLVSMRDITERKLAEQKLRATLAEKEVMMREIHHRVKNNMQMMSALLALQADYVKDETALGFFKDSQQRIQSMAMIHEQLYHNENIAQIDFAAYLHALTNNLRIQYGERCKQVNIQIETQPCTLPVDTAIPCGLAINELVSNAMKHAFSDGRAGELYINLRYEDGKVMLEVTDDGVGVPPGFDIHQIKSFGLQVVELMVEDQMHGKLTVELNESLRKSRFNHGTRVAFEIGVKKNAPKNIRSGRRCTDRQTIETVHRGDGLPVRGKGG